MTTNVIEKVENKGFEFYPKSCSTVFVEKGSHYAGLRELEEIQKEVSMKIMDHIPSDIAYSLLPDSQYFCEKFHALYKPLERKVSCNNRLRIDILEDNVTFIFNPHWHPHLSLYADKAKMNWVDLTTKDDLPKYECTRYYNKDKSREGVWNRFLQIEPWLLADY